MKNLTMSGLFSLKRFSALTATILLAFTLCSCAGVDPNVKQKEETKEAYTVQTTAPEETSVELEGYHAYGDGLTDEVKVKGTMVDVNAFALRSYELAYLVGTGSFKKPAKINVDALAQYAFTHLYYKNFYEIPNNKPKYCETSLSKLEKELKKHFGSVKADLKKSALYSKGKKKFEMWLPNYGANVYYRVDAADVSGDKVEIITTFFNELKKSTKLGRTTLTVRVKNGKPLISALSAE